MLSQYHMRLFLPIVAALTVWGSLPLTALAESTSSRRSLLTSTSKSTSIPRQHPGRIAQFTTKQQPQQTVHDLAVPSRILFRGGSSWVEDDTSIARGGGKDNNKKKDSPAKEPSSAPVAVTKTSKTTNIDNNRNEKIIAGSFAVAAVGLLIYHNRESLKPFVDKAYIQEKTLSILSDLESRPFAVPTYILGMAAWELLGMSTIPVETAAGMVFGLHRGLLASGTGKLLGASVAFALGRGLLSGFVQEKLSQNPVWSVLNRSTDVHSPLIVALLMKFSCFPEFIKNFGCACLEQMSYTTFLTATSFHGLMFTALWTALGVDAAARLENPLHPNNAILQVSLVLAALIGLVGSPLLMAWWIRDMKKLAEEKP